MVVAFVPVSRPWRRQARHQPPKTGTTVILTDKYRHRARTYPDLYLDDEFFPGQEPQVNVYTAAVSRLTVSVLRWPPSCVP